MFVNMKSGKRIREKFLPEVMNLNEMQAVSMLNGREIQGYVHL